MTRSCETCQTLSAPPQRFRVSLVPSDTEFNRYIAMDLMWIDKKEVLHVADLESKFSSASLLPNQTVEGVCVRSFHTRNRCTLVFS